MITNIKIYGTYIIESKRKIGLYALNGVLIFLQTDIYSYWISF